MKIFKVNVDNNPGGWKSGEDPSTLVLANTPEEAIQKVKDGWWNSLEWKEEDGKRVYSIVYKENGGYSYARADSSFSAIEVRFELEGYEVEIFNVRKKKLEQIKENEDNSDKSWSPI